MEHLYIKLKTTNYNSIDLHKLSIINLCQSNNYQKLVILTVINCLLSS